MSGVVNPIPEDYGALVVQLVVDDSAAAIAFYESAFGAKALYRQQDASGERVAHCELLMSVSRFMLHDEFAAAGLLSPKSLGGSPVTLMLYVTDVDAFHAHAVTHGAMALSEPEDRFWGLRSATLVDPFGHRWLIASRIEDLSPDEILRRAAEAAPGDLRPMGGCA